MGKYKKILVAFDGSESSKNALRQAIKLAQAEKSWIKVLAVVPPYEGDIELVGVSNIREVLKGPAEKLLSEVARMASAEGASIMTGIEQGEPYGQIVDVADAENCDIIVLGKKGVHRIERELMGSVTARVIGHSRRDVLVVPRGTALGWRNILLGIDGSKYSEAATGRAIDFAKSYGGNLTAVSVVDVTEEFYAQAPDAVDKLVQRAKVIVEEVRKRVEASGVKIETFVKEGDTHRKIVELAEEKKADIIFLGSHGRTGLKRLLMGSVTGRVIGLSSCPVLVVGP